MCRGRTSTLRIATTALLLAIVNLPSLRAAELAAEGAAGVEVGVATATLPEEVTRVATGTLPRAEHPRPDRLRDEWMNLNGTWEFAETDDAADESFLGDRAFPDEIIVPFVRESRLSGLGRTGFIKNVWYRRTFTLPKGWKSPRVLFHVGACDWRTRVWVNGSLAGTHVGGNTAFAFEITHLVRPGANRVIIHAFDDTRSGLQATGKQAHSLQSEGCVYTRTTGIWQTVWLEGVGSSYVADASIVCDPDQSRAIVELEVLGPSNGLAASVTASFAGKTMGSAKVPAAWRNTRLVLDLAEKHLWNVETPALYDLELTLTRGGEVVDRLRSYFGLRTVTIEGQAILINGRPVFQRTVLDQGFYPDGIWTAPSDEALRRDVELSKAVGFNGARLHQKVFEPRLLYWADRLGYLLWGEFPNWGLDYARHEIELPVINEWVEILRRDRNHPSIIGWCPFNETPPAAGPLQSVIVTVTRAVDPTRPVIESSGYAHTIADPEVLDAHDYNGDPASFRTAWMSAFHGKLGLPARYGSSPGIRVPFFVSEYGGIGWYTPKPGEPAWGYGNAPKTLEEFYARYQGLTDAQLDNRFLFGFCYTQLTDVEQERNGIYHYDRTPKFDAAKLHAINARTARYETEPPLGEAECGPTSWRLLLGAHPDGGLAGPWRFTTTAPVGEWMKPAFDDAAWKTGAGAFGSKGGFEDKIQTAWKEKDIWLRREFEWDGTAFGIAALVIHFDNATEVSVNGKEIWRGDRWVDAYVGFEVTAELARALEPGKNVIAVHCHQDDGGQFIDLAILLGSREK